MGMSVNLNKIVDSKVVGMSVFALTGVGKLVSDYKNAPDDKKDFVLLRDSLILGGSAMGVVGYEYASRKLTKNKFIQNKLNALKETTKQKIKNSTIYQKALKPIHQKFDKSTHYCIEQVKNVTKDCANNTLMVASGIFGAIAADYGIRYSHLDKNKKLRKLTRPDENRIGTLYKIEDKLINKWQNSAINKDLENTVGTEVKSNIYSRITDMPAMKMFNKTMVGMQGFEVIEEKTFKERMKHARKCLITNSLVPLFFLSISSSLTKNLKGIVRIPIVFSSLVAGTMYTNKTITSIGSSTQKTKPKKEFVKPPQQTTTQSSLSTQSGTLVS